MEENSADMNSSTLSDLDADREEEFVEIVSDVIKKDPEVLERIMDDEDVQRMIMVRQQFSGPLPPPSLIAGYEKFCPGATDRFLGHLESNQAHVQKLESTALNANINKDVDNRRYGYHLTILSLVSVLVLGVTGHDFLAGTIGTTTIGTILAMFILNKPPKEKDEENKDQVEKPGVDDSVDEKYQPH